MDAPKLPGLTKAEAERLTEGLRMYAAQHQCTLREAVERFITSPSIPIRHRGEPI